MLQVVTWIAAACMSAGLPTVENQPAPPQSGAPAPMDPAALDQILAPIALYPDALILQIVQCAASPYQVNQVSQWLRQNPDLKGTAVQDAATAQGFDASFIAIVIFPDVLSYMAGNADWTRQLGQAFTTDRDGVFTSIQRLRTQAQQVGNLKSSDQQQVQNVSTQSGQQVIIIQPANPQVVYVPQYDPQVVYTQPAPPPAKDDDTGKAAAAALIGFAAGVIVGAAADDDDDHYYYASGGWGYRGPALCNDGWNDYYHHRENMANDYYDHRENMASDYYDHRENMAGQAGENQSNRQTARSDTQANAGQARSDNQAARQSSASQRQSSAQATQANRQSSRQAATGQAQTNRASASSRGSFQGLSQPAARTGTNSGAFTGYQRGSTERASSDRGRRSLSRSGGGRSGHR